MSRPGGGADRAGRGRGAGRVGTEGTGLERGGASGKAGAESAVLA